MKKIIIDGAQGDQILMAQQAFAEAFRQQRMVQNAKDRTEALRSLDPEVWQVFSLRWNLPPPFPKGWGDETSLLAVMHKVRLMLPEFSPEEKKFSAAWVVGHGMDLPDGLTYENGELKGTASGRGPVR
jgi:hypothetical protein